MTIPDLRSEHTEITLEHCSVLLEGMNKALGMMYEDGQEEFQLICDNINPEAMKSDLSILFTPKAFSNLFRSPMGKGILIGAFLQRIMNEGEQ